MNPTDIANFEHIIGKPRLQSYRSYFKTRSPEATIGLYMWNGELSSCFAALLSYFEICLRNSIHIAMASHYIGAVNSSAHWWDVVAAQLGTRTMEKVKAVREKNGTPRIPAPSADEIVSRVTFGFWTAVLGRVDKHQAHVIMPAIFPDHPLNARPNEWKDSVKRKKAISFAFEMNDFRNRLAHHEPLRKFGSIKDTSTTPATLVVAASTDLQSTRSRFARLIGLYDEAMSSISATLHRDLLKSSWRTRLTFLLSDRGIERYVNTKYALSDIATTSSYLHQNFARVVKQNAPVRIRRARKAGIFIPE
ncbi:hypothetical protein [Trinickia dinghuensis]|nr:hypothetical protein [Trinickia dinghuensis]